MKYLIDISQNHSQKVQKLIEQRRYESIAQFVSAALENQLHLEESGLDTISDNSTNKNVFEKNTDFTQTLSDTKLINIKSNPKEVPAPAFEQLVLSQQDVAEKNIWLWGQFNKILPVKIGVRILYRELGNNERISLDDFVEKAANEAALIGDVIRAKEEIEGKIRDEKISAALPGMAEEKSRARYKAQFLLVSQKDGVLNGAMALLRFANVERKNNNRNYMIGLTRAGIEFAKILNPVLDDNNYDKSLSREESDFYLNHTAQYVKNEYAAIKWILNKINKGVNTRENINNELKNDYGQIWESSDAVINTQRAGLMSRMFELGLLEREKRGIKVTYRLSEFGKSYLKQK